MSWDAGFTYPAAIGNYVWFDADKDGIYDSTEQPLFDIKVTLYITRDGQSVVVATQQTNKKGEFYFGNLPPGDYWLTFDAGGPAEFTIPGLDSNVDPATGGTRRGFAGTGRIQDSRRRLYFGTAGPLPSVG